MRPIRKYSIKRRTLKRIESLKSIMNNVLDIHCVVNDDNQLNVKKAIELIGCSESDLLCEIGLSSDTDISNIKIKNEKNLIKLTQVISIINYVKQFNSKQKDNYIWYK